MAEKPNFARVVLTTASNPEEAEGLGRALAEEQLVACATFIPSVRSINRWQGAVEYAQETLLLLKTGVEQLPPLQTRLAALHTYETPEFLVLPVESGRPKYLDWLMANLREP
ncbi:MAG: divalent-cation tolerance protein CutA [Terracidiphilus sp.]